MASIGPFWNGNEVWLIAAGAALFALFPVAYASSFSGFYLPFIVVLWLLMFRGIALELREHFPSELWHQFWDAAFSLSSALLIVVFGIALGNLLRGVPLDAAGLLSGDVRVSAQSVRAARRSLRALHARAARRRLRGDARRRRARERAGDARALVGGLLLYLAVTACDVCGRTPRRRALAFRDAGALAGRADRAARGPRPAACTSGLRDVVVFIATLLIASAGTLFPYLLPAFPPGRGGISIFEAAPSAVALTCAFTVTIGGIVVVAIYGSIVWRRMGGKVRVE